MKKKKSTPKDTPTPEYDSKRQQNVLLEKISKDVKTVAEGHGVLDRKLDEVNNKLEEHGRRFNRRDSELNSINMAVRENSRDIKGLQKGQEEIKQKLDTVTSDHEQRIQKLEVVR